MMIILEDYAVDVLCQDRSLDVTGLPDELQSVVESLIQGSILQQGVLWLWGSVCFCICWILSRRRTCGILSNHVVARNIHHDEITVLFP